MALNKTIIKKVRAKTESEPEIGDFLVSLLELESETPGWWKPKYNSILENACKEEIKDANN
jgi:hypothetical protein